MLLVKKVLLLVEGLQRTAQQLGVKPARALQFVGDLSPNQLHLPNLQENANAITGWRRNNLFEAHGALEKKQICWEVFPAHEGKCLLPQTTRTKHGTLVLEELKELSNVPFLDTQRGTILVKTICGHSCRMTFLDHHSFFIEKRLLRTKIPPPPPSPPPNTMSLVWRRG